MARRLPPLSALRPFEAAARLESFSRAADELHLTHGAISRQVRALEDHVGCELFNRHGKRVTLTTAGRGFAERVRAALHEIAQAAEALGTARRENRVTVSVLPSFASRWLMPRLIRFMEAHPDIEVSVVATTALANFTTDDVDIAIRFGRGPYPPHVCEAFLEDEWFPVASPKVKQPKEPRDMLRMRIIREDRDYWDDWFLKAGVVLERPLTGGPNFTTDDVDIAIRFGRGPYPPHVCEAFLEDEWFPVASPKIKQPKEPRDMLRMRIIREDRDYWDDWFLKAGVVLERPLTGGPNFNDATYSIQAAARGEGIALARRSIIGEDLERGTLKRLFRIAVQTNERYWFVSPREIADAPKVRAFRDWVKSELR